jgi:Polyketide cyclase / dehydrase and lipid transport
MGRVTVVAEIAAPPSRVWRAITAPAEVARWDGVVPTGVPDDYPVAGQHARWGTRIAFVPLVLHDRIRVVEAERCLASSIDVGLVHVEERYTLDATPSGTRLTSDNDVSARLTGLGWLAVRLSARSIRASMTRLVAHCEAPA